MNNQNRVLQGEETLLSVDEFCCACAVQIEWVVALVDEAIVEPSGRTENEWKFSGAGLTRARTVRRLQQDLGINLAGAAVILDLMDELTVVRARLLQEDNLC